MPIDVDQPQSDGWWLHQLARRLEQRNKDRLDRLDRYHRGDPPLPEGSENMRTAYRAFQRKARVNFAELIAEAPRERMTPAGFVPAGDDVGEADEKAQSFWDDNDLAVESADVHESMLALGDSYVIVGPPDGTGSPVITGEDPRQVITAHDPARPRQVRAAVKLYHDTDTQTDTAYLYLPGRVRVATRKVRRLGTDPKVRWAPASWSWDEDRSGSLDVDRVPVVRFRNRRGVGEFESHVDALDRINHMILQRMVIATFQAFKQRAAKNAPLKDPHGNDIDYEKIFTADPGAIWALPEGMDMWESGQVDLTPLLSSVRDDLKDLAAATRTPLAFLTPDAAAQSAEGASFQREGLVFKTEDRITRATSGWLDVMSLAFETIGDPDRARRGALTMLWRPVERFSLAERADAASKAGDVPWQTRMTTIWQYTPAEVKRMATERAQDSLLQPDPDQDGAEAA